MATLSPQSVVSTGLNPSYAAATGGGDAIPADGRTFLHVKNGDSSSHTVTIASVAVARAGLAVANLAVAVPAGAERMIAIDPTGYADPTTGLAAITYSAVTSVTVAAVRV